MQEKDFRLILFLKSFDLLQMSDYFSRLYKIQNGNPTNVTFQKNLVSFVLRRDNYGDVFTQSIPYT